ncbi:hypothetical protein MAJ_10977, partial [Metarhizium majus ARSEF 297]
MFHTLGLELVPSESPKARRLPGLGLIDIVDGLVNGLIPTLMDLATQGEKECRFVGEMTATLLLNYNDTNVVIFQDQKGSIQGLQDRICYEKAIPQFFSDKVYQICVFTEGEFIRSGDGGCRNWGFGKCAKTTSDVAVNFCRRTANAPITTTTTTTSTTLQVQQRHRLQQPLHQSAMSVQTLLPLPLLPA